MSNSSKQPLRTFVIRDGKLRNPRTYPSEDISMVMMSPFYRMIDEVIDKDETKTLTWEGYLYIHGDDDYSYYRRAAFVLTEKNLHISTGNLSQKFVLTANMTDCESYCLFNTNADVLPSFVLNFPDAIEFLHDREDNIEQELLKELERRNIFLA